MEELRALYKQLSEKYHALKTQKEIGLEKFSQAQELKFLEFVSVSEDTVKCLTDENKKLKAKINDLMSSNRATEDEYFKYQKLLAEEKEKTQELFGEVEVLRKLMSKGSQRNDINGTNYDGKLRSPSGSSQVSPERNKKTQPKCCGSFQTNSGGELSDTGRANCLFQTLIQCLVGMQFSVDDRAEELSVSVLHQSSGYSFSLTLVNCSGNGEAELLYHVQSLGTLERVAPSWMREDIVFGMNMCPTFFERVLRVTKGLG